MAAIDTIKVRSLVDLRTELFNLKAGIMRVRTMAISIKVAAVNLKHYSSSKVTANIRRLN